MSDSTRNANDPFALKAESTPPNDFALAPTETTPAEENAESTHPPMAWMLLRELVETVVLSLVIFLLIRMVVQNYRIESHSMLPNFHEGQFILVNKLAYKLGEPARGEVVVFHNPRNPDEDYIKRVIGLPGDTVAIYGQTVYINDEPLPQPYATNPLPPGYVFEPQEVPPDHIFVMGDNRPNSQDSRFASVGPIAEDLIVGKAWLRVWPFAEFGLVAHYHLEPGDAALSAAPDSTGLEAACCSQE
ncbi:MAG: signal peptidase I [Chloroflexi bacterium]|nr:MAG: signal peptidase I [Chloroflexota bacterium]